jgi:hypothetical protein
MSRRQPAERLTDVAYALVVRSPVALQIDGRRVVVPDAEELLVQWDVGYADGRLRLKMWRARAPNSSRKQPSSRMTRATITDVYARYVSLRAIRATAIGTVEFTAGNVPAG